MQLDKIEAGVRMILEGLEVGDDRNFDETPQRVAQVYAELFEPEPTGWPVFDEDYTDEVILRGHRFYTLCPHHLLPVEIIASVGYIPHGKVIGASKLARMIHEVNTKPKTQERLTADVMRSVLELTGGSSKGEAVILRGKHGCFSMRGVKTSASLVTAKFRGEFDTPEMRTRFFELVREAGV